MKVCFYTSISRIAVGATLLLASPVFAQQSPVADSDRVEPSSTAAAVQDEQEDSGEIVVTANRQSSLLSKTPIAITAATGDSLLKTGVTNATQLAEVMPNLAIDRNGGGLQITIRGVSSTDNSEKGDPSAGFVVDGIFIARPQAQEVSFFDLDRIEVLRGPQGTLYGRNTTAGLVSLITARPRLGQFSGSADFVYGNYDTVQATGVLNIPIGESVALRAAANYDRRDSFYTPGASNFALGPVKDNLSGRLSLLIEPTSRLNIVIRGDYSAIKGRPSATSALSTLYQAPFVVPAAGQLGVDPLRRNIDRDAAWTIDYPEIKQAKGDNATWGVQGEINYTLSDGLTVNYLGGYRKLNRDEEWSGFLGRLREPNIFVSVPMTFDGDYEQNSQELRLAYDSGILNLQVGGYYFHETSRVDFYLYGSQEFLPGQRGYVFGFPQDTKSRSIAAFGQSTINLTPRFRATGGVRWTQDDKERIGATIFHANVGDPVDFTTGTQPGTTNPRGVTDSLNNAEVRYNRMTWKAGLDYDVSDRTLLYGSVSSGYKAGGFNDGCLAGTPNCSAAAITPANVLFYEPETVVAYEAGIKTRTLDNTLRMAASVFHYDYSNLQLTQLAQVGTAPVARTLNAGRAKIDGVELESTLRPAPNHQLDLAATWLNARYTDYAIDPSAPLTAQFAGRKLDRSPEWTAMASYTWTVPLGSSGGDIQFNARTRLSDSYVITAPAMRAQFRQPSFTKTDLSVTYNGPDQRFYLQGFVRNVEDAVTLGNASPSANFGAAFDDGFAQLADPRLYGVRAGVRF